MENTEDKREADSTQGYQQNQENEDADLHRLVHSMPPEITELLKRVKKPSVSMIDRSPDPDMQIFYTQAQIAKYAENFIKDGLDLPTIVKMLTPMAER